MPKTAKQRAAACKVRHIPKGKRKAFKNMSKKKLDKWCRSKLHK